MARPASQIFISALLLAASACTAQPYVVLGGERFTVEIADDPRERARGLMFQQSLAPDEGMLFIYEQPAPRRFWMKNTVIPLDILFFDAHGELINVHTAPPCRADPCPQYASDGLALLVLELNAGTAERLGIEPEARLEVHWQ